MATNLIVPPARLVTCPSCSLHLHAPATLRSTTALCPRCGFTVSIPNGEPVPPPVGAEFPAHRAEVLRGEWQDSVDGKVKLEGVAGLVSGRTIHFTELLLFDIEAIANAHRIRAQADQQLAGFKSPLGFIGGLGFVLTGIAATMAVEALASSAMQTTGAKKLEEHYHACRSVRSGGHFIPLHQITNLRVADPATWRCVWLNQAGEITKGFAHNGDRSVVVKTTDGVITSVIWDKVEQWDFVKPAHQ